MRRLHPLTAVIRGFSSGIALGFIAATVLPIIAREASLALPAIGGPVGFAVGAGWSYLTYRRFTYELTTDTFDLGKGVIARTEREIPLRRVQNVDVEQSILGQLLGLAVVRIETAGGGSTEATLSYVSKAEAQRLQRGIRDRRAALAPTDERGAEPSSEAGPDSATEQTADSSVGADRQPGEGPAEAPAHDGTDTTSDPTGPASVEDPGDRDGAEDRAGGPGVTGEARRDRASPTAAEDLASEDEWQYRVDELSEPLVTLRARELALLAVTNFQIGSLIFVLVGIPILGDVAIRFLVAAAEPFGGPTTLDTAAMTPDQYFILGGVAGPIVAVAGYVMSAVVTAQNYYDFELARRGEDLVYERGLLQRYSGSIPTDKIQTLTVTETAPMRWLGYAALGVETAGYAGGGAEGGSQAAVPLATRERVQSLAHELFAFDPVDLDRPPKRARTRYTARYSIVVLAVATVLYGASMVVADFTLWWVPLIVLPVVPVAAHLKWSHLGYALGEDHVVVRHGFWRRRTHIVPYYRLQTIIGEATIFQRRRDLASLVADTASSATISRSAPTAYDLDADTVSDLQTELRDRLQEHLHDGALDQ